MHNIDRVFYNWKFISGLLSISKRKDNSYCEKIIPFIVSSQKYEKFNWLEKSTFLSYFLGEHLKYRNSNSAVSRKFLKQSNLQIAVFVIIEFYWMIE